MKKALYRKNPFGKYAGDFLSKKDFIKKVKRKERQGSHLACLDYKKGV